MRDLSGCIGSVLATKFYDFSPEFSSKRAGLSLSLSTDGRRTLPPHDRAPPTGEREKMTDLGLGVSRVERAAPLSRI